MEAAALRRSLVFAGFMGAGKSKLAREAAQALGAELRDTDALVAAELGEPVPGFWEREGEAAFREREEQAVLGALDGEPAVVALGGGSLASARVREALARHVVVLLDVDPGVAWSRVEGSARPLARDRARFDALHAERLPRYRELATATLADPAIETLHAALPSLHALAASEDALTLRMLWAQSASGSYPVWLGAGAISAAPWPLPDSSRRIAVSDANVAERYAALVPGLAGLIEIEPGEEHKSLATAERVWHALVAQGATRADHLVAVGGGVVGDLAGFCAATFQRGIPVVQVPTTLVAQVDSAYGGKTGVDLPQAKNYVGAYHQPAAVIADPAALTTLPAAELAAGYAEVVKTALIAGGPLWDLVAGGAVVDERVILECARTKLAVVAADERDGGLRQVLNLGHTVGHAIETVTGYRRLRHGEAVGLGLLAALRLSGADVLRGQVGELLSAAGLPVALDELDVDGVLEATRRDKKRLGEALPFVLCEAPGAVRHGVAVDPDDLRAAVAELVSPGA